MFGSATYYQSTTPYERMWDAERAVLRAEKALADARERLDAAKREVEESQRQPMLAAKQAFRAEQSLPPLAKS